MPSTGLNHLLLIEVGGTHTRCAVTHGGRTPERVTVFRNADHEDLESVVAVYLDKPGIEPPPRAALAAAAPVNPQSRYLTNIGWVLDIEALKQRFGWQSAIVVNDFEALACAIPVLTPDELFNVRPGVHASGRPIAVLGPGTGLGVAGLVPCGDTWYPVSGEGGHVTLAAMDEREDAVLRALRREYGHVSAERVLSGPGLLALYRIVAVEAAADSPSEVTRRAEAGDPRALEALDLFFLFLGTVCGDLALTLGARGGVYLGGGILPAIKEQLVASGFAERFADKGRFTAYLHEVPIKLIMAETPALRGLARHPRLTGSEIR